MGQLLNGGFSEKFARNKKWKIDKGLLRAIREVIPQSTWGIRTSVVDLGAGSTSSGYGRLATGVGVSTPHRALGRYQAV